MKVMMSFALILFFCCCLGGTSFANAGNEMDASRIVGNVTYSGRIRGMKKDRFRDSEAEIKNFIRCDPLIMTPNPEPYSITNADGSVTPLIQLIRLSNGFFEVTRDGYTVSYINGYYMYMQYDSDSASMVSSGLIAGVHDPQIAMSKTSGKLLEKNEQLKLPIKMGTLDTDVVCVTNNAPKPTGKKKLLVVPFKFQDHADRTLPTIANLTVLMNSVSPHINICPSGSVRNYFLKNSFDKFDLTSTVAPSWVSVSNTEAYYAHTDNGRTCRGLEMIVEALNALEATGFDFTPFDGDNNGVIEEISFFHSGYDAAQGGIGWESRIWSFAWSLAGVVNKTQCIADGKWTSTKSKKSVIRFSIFTSLWGTSDSNIGRIGVIAHELGHLFGLPDLYDYNKEQPKEVEQAERIGKGVGNYCLMGTGNWGFDDQQLYPSHLSAWSKVVKAKWFNSTPITSSGTYTALQACRNPVAFEITKNFPPGEYLLIENRFKCAFDQAIPGPGLAIYHVDEKSKEWEGRINEYEGYPGQTGWPANGKHYRVALLQADGLYNLEKGNNEGDATDLFGATVTSIGPGGTSNGMKYPNTNSYQNGIITDTCITIKNIGKPSAAVSFEVSFDCTKPVPAPKPKPVPRPVPFPKPGPSPFTTLVCPENVGLHITLEWTGNDDLDLHVQPPCGEEIYYVNQRPDPDNPAPGDVTGYFLEDDGNVGGNSGYGDYVESAHFSPLVPVGSGSTPAGQYSFWVENYALNESPDTWTLKVYEGDQLVQSYSGSVTDKSITYTYTRNVQRCQNSCSSTAGTLPGCRFIVRKTKKWTLPLQYHSVIFDEVRRGVCSTVAIPATDFFLETDVDTSRWILGNGREGLISCDNSGVTYCVTSDWYIVKCGDLGCQKTTDTETYSRQNYCSYWITEIKCGRLNPKPVPRPVPFPKPKPVPRPVPLPKPKPVPRPAPLPKPKPVPTPSTVIFREDFLGPSLDPNSWVVEEGKLGRTKLGNTPIINGGIARLTFDTYQFKGTEIFTKSRYSRGTKGLEIEAKIKLGTPLPSGLVTSFYTWAENSSGSVDEIDVEILSKQLNLASDKALLFESYNDFTGYEGLPHYWSSSMSISHLDVGTWHIFTIRWTPGRTYWLVDGVVVADSDKAQPNANSYIGLLFWAPDSDWPGAYDRSFQPVTNPASNIKYYFDIDYVEIRRLL